MFETSLSLSVLPWALKTDKLDKSYYKCWQGLKSNFKEQQAEEL